MDRQSPLRDVALLLASLSALAVAGALLQTLPAVSTATVALAFLLIVLGTATIARLRVAILASIAAMAVLNFFFLPPIGTFSIVDPQNWIALCVFLVVAVIASNLSAAAQNRAREAIDRRNEVTRLFDLTRDVLQTTETSGAVEALARHVSRRFDLSRVAICLPAEPGWRVYQGGTRDLDVGGAALNTAFANARDTEARQLARAGGVHAGVGNGISSIPLRHGTRVIGLLVVPSEALDVGTLDAVAGVVAIAIERAHFLAERDAAELVRQRADLASTLLASLSHDLRTPLTAIKAAVENLRSDLPPAQREGQARAATAEVDRLTRLFQDILDMARIDGAAIRVARQWVTAEDVVDAASAHVRDALEGHHLRVDADSRLETHIDPRLASGALSHVLENAAQYSPRDKEIHVNARVEPDGLHVSVTRDPGWIRQNSITSSIASIVAGPSARPPSVPGWGCRSHAGCWPPQAGGSRPKTWREERDSRSSCRGRSGRWRSQSSHRQNAATHSYRRRRTEHRGHRGAAAPGPGLRGAVGNDGARRPRHGGSESS